MAAISREDIKAELLKSFPYVEEDMSFARWGIRVWRCTDKPLDTIWSGDQKNFKMVNFAIVDGYQLSRREFGYLLPLGISAFQQEEQPDLSVVDVGFFSGYGKIGRGLTPMSDLNYDNPKGEAA